MCYSRWHCGSFCPNFYASKNDCYGHGSNGSCDLVCVAKLVPLAYGIHKLQITCVVEDEKVSVDDLTEKICEDFEDLVSGVGKDKKWLNSWTCNKLLANVQLQRQKLWSFVSTEGKTCCFVTNFCVFVYYCNGIW